jgi:GNAT superfamily N-acetyltransferase
MLKTKAFKLYHGADNFETRLRSALSEWLERAKIRAYENSFGNHSSFLRMRELRVYMRLSHRIVHGVRRQTFSVATIDVVERLQRRGLGTIFFSLVEEMARAEKRVPFVESVCNPDLRRLLQKRGYHDKPDDLAADMFLLPDAKP